MADNILGKIFEPSARGKIWRLFTLIVVVVFIAGMVDAGNYYNKGVDLLAEKTGQSVKLPKVTEVPFHLGLDLLGGTHLVYTADMSQIESKDRTSALEGVRDVIERRVNLFGVSEPLVQTTISGDDYRIIVELAGIKDVSEAIAMIGETPLLEFKEQDTSIRTLSEEEQKTMDEFNADAEEKAIDVLAKVVSGGDFAALAKEFSKDTNTKDNGGNLDWITAMDDQQMVDVVKDFEVGETTKELIQAVNGYEIFKLNDKRQKTNPFDETVIEKEVKASHLLLCHNEVEGCSNDLSKEDALLKMKEIEKEATLSNFSDLVKENSTEPGAENGGGELGWFDRSAMVKPFADTVFDNQEVGTISYIVETQFGYHLIYKQDEREILEYNVSHIFIPTISERDIIGDQLDWKLTELTGKNLDRARISFNPNDNSPEVSLEFDGEGSDLFADITERNVNKPVAIFLDGEPISTPNVNEKITGGRAVISGTFNILEAKLLVQRLNAGALPVPIDIVNQQTVGATLGHASLESSLKAGLIGLILVAIFMIFYYRLPGVFAVMSLVIYGIVILAIFKLWPVTLTLSGMAGVILSIGMAVDANVLIFERLKEELGQGKPGGIAIRDAFDRAWPSIRDGNISTLMTCVILYVFTTSVVRGFAVTLGFGVLISMTTAIYVTRNLLQLFISDKVSKNTWLLGYKSSNKS